MGLFNFSLKFLLSYVDLKGFLCLVGEGVKNKSDDVDLLAFNKDNHSFFFFFLFVRRENGRN